LLFASSTEKLAAVHHSDGKSAWVVGHQLHDNIFNAYLISPEGLNTASIVSTTGQVHVSGRYYMKFYPDGKQLISLPDNDFSSTDKQPELFDFDASSGKLTSKFVCTFSSYEPYYGGSFSPNGQVVYFAVTNWYGGIRLHQYNLQAPIPTDIIASRYLIENNQKAAIIYTTVKLIAL
jgi:Tol biopolymer transport system component